jgi:hypothetical protein
MQCLLKKGNTHSVNFSVTIPFIFREENRSKVFENTVMKRIFGLMTMEEARGWEKSA